jgi:hypothetical protein
MRKLWDFLGGRKFMVLILATGLLFSGKLTSSDWVIIAGIYTAINAVQKFVPGNKE